MTDLQIGTQVGADILNASFNRRGELLWRVRQAKLDHVFSADHISFFVGAGMDGLIQAATVMGAVPDLRYVVGIYLLALRHPVPVARQLATLSEAGPGRLVLGVGVGGEDRHEIEICGVDPSTRGRRTDACLEALNGLLSGQSFSYESEFFSFEDALIKPAPSPRIPILIGGRSDAAVRRTAKFGDGWLGAWCSHRRFGEVVDQTAQLAADAGREVDQWMHGMQPWVGIGASRDEARARLAKGMEDFYRIPFERFEKYSPYGTADEVADFLAPYVEKGCRVLNIMPVADSPEAGIDAVAEIADRLRSVV